MSLDERDYTRRERWYVLRTEARRAPPEYIILKVVGELSVCFWGEWELSSYPSREAALDYINALEYADSFIAGLAIGLILGPDGEFLKPDGSPFE